MESTLPQSPTGVGGLSENHRSLEAEEFSDGRLRKGAETAERILNAAEELFAENGYAGTTLRDIAARAEIRNPSIYNHLMARKTSTSPSWSVACGPCWSCSAN